MYHKEEELSPIEVAVEDMKAKVTDLTEVVCQRTPDIKKLQLKLQGSVSVQVHAGPVAYAEVFLSKRAGDKWHHNKIAALKEHFRYAMFDSVQLSRNDSQIAFELQNIFYKFYMLWQFCS